MNNNFLVDLQITLTLYIISNYLFKGFNNSPNNFKFKNESLGATFWFSGAHTHTKQNLKPFAGLILRST